MALLGKFDSIVAFWDKLGKYHEIKEVIHRHFIKKHICEVSVPYCGDMNSIVNSYRVHLHCFVQ